MRNAEEIIRADIFINTALQCVLTEGGVHPHSQGVRETHRHCQIALASRCSAYDVNTK